MNKRQRVEWRDYVCATTDLTPAHKLVLLVLSSFADYPDGTNARPGVAHLAARCALKSRAVEAALARGRGLGLIQQTARANPKRSLAATYRLTLDGVSTRTDMQVESEPETVSNRTGMRPDDDFNPHETDFNPHDTPFQPAPSCSPPSHVHQATTPSKLPARAREEQLLADQLIRDSPYAGHPEDVRNQATRKVVKMLVEGLDPDGIRESLRRFHARLDLRSFEMLSHLYSDVLRERDATPRGPSDSVEAILAAGSRLINRMTEAPK